MVLCEKYVNLLILMLFYILIRILVREMKWY